MKSGILENDVVRLRALEPEDLDLLYDIENDSGLWEVSNTQTPFSRDLLKEYLKNAHQDIYEAKQLRMVICKISDQSVLGMIDLFNFNPQHNRAGIGIFIARDKQNRGYASGALEIFLNYAFRHLDLHQLYADIPVGNSNSLQLFKKFNFAEIGTRKDWIKNEGKFQDVSLFQLINPNHS
jgi:diamine N-acetyltransferase